MGNVIIYIAAMIVIINGALSCVTNKAMFLNDFIGHNSRPASVVSLMKMSKPDRVKFTRELNKNNVAALHSIDPIFERNINHVINNNIYIIDLNEESTKFLIQVENSKIFSMPARWMTFFESDGIISGNSTSLIHGEINRLLNPIDIRMNTEFYVVVHDDKIFHLNLVYRINKKLSLIWEESGTWDPERRLNLKRFDVSLTMRRKDLRGLDLVATSVITDNSTKIHNPNYENRGIDVSSKVIYHMVVHLFEWMNSTPTWNSTKTWGYLQADGKSFNGLIQEMNVGRTDIPGAIYFPTTDRLKVVEYSVSPAQHLDLFFVFSKPALASVNNVFFLPFGFGVWVATFLLIVLLSFTLCCAYFGERKKNKYYDLPFKKRLLEGFHETMCVVFQQGTSADPITLSCREILLVGLLSFMFLYTAYSAKIIGLLQSSTDDIKTVADLVTSPLSFGAYNTDYNKAIFFARNKSKTELDFFEKKVTTKGDKFFLSLEEGIEKVQSGLYGFLIERTNGIDHIQKTFYEREKCNLGFVHYLAESSSFCYFSIPKQSKYKEQLRVGATRMIEFGIQSRSARRMTPELPKCSDGAAIFTAVTMMDVAPALKTLMVLYSISVFIMVIEIWIQRKRKRNLLRMLRKIEQPISDING